MNDTDSDVVAITQLVSLYGLAVTERLRTGPIANSSRLISRRFTIPSIPPNTQCPPM